ncbi:MAG: LTA synthase family protein [Xanthobacteraceae bacterium]|nr:LTA synthase family protein [Xanthobacteraceae bacterium]
MTEADFVARAAFLFAWALLNFFWLLLLRRPGPAAALSLAMIGVLILLSKFKRSHLLENITIIDVMLVDPDTIAYLWAFAPDLRTWVVGAALIGVPAVLLIWWCDPVRIYRRWAAAGLVASFAALAAVSYYEPLVHGNQFYNNNFVSRFARSGAVAAVDLTAWGMFEAEAPVPSTASLPEETQCEAPARLPNIIMILDESSFDATALPGLALPPDYRNYFRSLDNKQRNLVVEGAGGPTWFTEYNVLAGLSVRSFGRFAGAVTRLAAGKVERGLPLALQRCGYKTYSMYTAMGAFVGARGFHTTAGIQRFIDSKELGTIRQPDIYYYDFATRLMTWELGRAPVFIMIYTSFNHFPWHHRFREDLTPGWPTAGMELNGLALELDEYVRRQSISARDFPRFLSRLKSEFPSEPFLIVRFGDHQPSFVRSLVDPNATEGEVVRRIQNSDPRYFTTYYAIDAVNFKPVDMSSWLDTLDASYLPLAILEAAGVPLDPSFVEQKKILQRCKGVFYFCNDGAEARRFNRLLIDAGYISGF